jgi:hypothetical protein
MPAVVSDIVNSVINLLSQVPGIVAGVCQRQDTADGAGCAAAGVGGDVVA